MTFTSDISGSFRPKLPLMGPETAVEWKLVLSEFCKQYLFDVTRALVIGSKPPQAPGVSATLMLQLPIGISGWGYPASTILSSNSRSESQRPV